MKQLDSHNDFFDSDHDMNNIIRINNSTDTDNDDVEDYDFDYDPNEMYFALNGKD
ncbi:MAG TPA: hypothetical protein VK528_06855 [Flavobacterium sp.]|nr:hypothetical protein [Flavobacterium sp.]